MYYLACPNSECKRKVKPETDQMGQDNFWCEHCSRHYRTCAPTYIFQAKVADFTDAMVVMFARDNGTPLLGGLTADQFRDFKQSQQPADSVDASAVVQDYLDSQCLSNLFSLCLKAKWESFRGEYRLRFFAQRVIPLTERDGLLQISHVQSENFDLLERLRVYSGITGPTKTGVPRQFLPS